MGEGEKKDGPIRGKYGDGNETGFLPPSDVEGVTPPPPEIFFVEEIVLALSQFVSESFVDGARERDDRLPCTEYYYSVHVHGPV